MSGKGKGKGKSKKKDNFKPKAKEIILFDVCINLERFAYDVIKYTALKFHVPESCIAVWKDKCNDYGCDDFLLVVCIEIIGYQITYRRLYHSYFNQHYEENKLATPDLIGALLFKVIKELTGDFTLSPLSIVEISLSIACELFLFLYSKDMDLNPKKLAATWYECYLNIHKKDFENAGGVQEMYLESYCSKCDVVDSFLNKFIEAYCLPYRTTASNPNLKKDFLRLAIKARDAYLSLAEKDTVEKVRDLKRFCEIFQRLTSFKSIEHPSPAGATGFNQPESTGQVSQSGFNQPESTGQVSQSNGSFETTSQELPVIVPEIQPWLLRPLSREERTKRLNDKCPFNKNFRKLLLDSLEKGSSDQKPSVSIATAQSYEQQRARPRDRAQNTGSSVCRQWYKLG